MIPNKGIIKFKKIMKEKYGVDLTDEEAQEQGQRLVDLIQLLIEIDRKNRKRAIIPCYKIL